MRRRIFFFLISFFFLMGGMALISSFFLQIWREKRALSHPTPMEKIVQKREGDLQLPTAFLAQLLGLSCDQPSDFYVWDEKKAEENLKSFPLFAAVTVKKVWPKTVMVHYTLRKPIAWLYDYEKVAFDDQGYLFPIPPFLKVGNMTEVYLGLPPFGREDPLTSRKGGSWNEPLKGKQMEIALHLLKLLSEDVLQGVFCVERIDLSKIFADSYGKREIVIMTTTRLQIQGKNAPFVALFPQTLRLNPNNYAAQLGNYLVLHQKMMKDYQEQMRGRNYPAQEVVFRSRIVDLRLDKLAFVDEH